MVRNAIRHQQSGFASNSDNKWQQAGLWSRAHISDVGLLAASARRVFLPSWTRAGHILGFRSSTYLSAWCIVEWVGQSIVPRILAVRRRAAHYLFHNFNDLPNNIATVAAGTLFEQILNCRADCHLGVVGAIKNI